VAHDSHNIIAIGTAPDVLCRAVNRVSKAGGYYITDGNDDVFLKLDVAGLMSTSSCSEVAKMEEEASEMLKRIGCKLPSPFTTLSFQSLLVIPELKLSDKGLFDSRKMKFVDLIKS
jgi:adenine deaminase